VVEELRRLGETCKLRKQNTDIIAQEIVEDLQQDVNAEKLKAEMLK